MGINTTSDTSNHALTIIRTIAWIEYVPMSLLGVLGPIFATTLSSAPTTIVGGEVFLITLGILVATWLGLMAMRRSLQSLEDKQIAEFWSLLAVVLAPFSAAAYLIAEALVVYQLVGIGSPLLMHPLFALTYHLIPVIGFYMPFMLLTIWANYRYRRDTF